MARPRRHRKKWRVRPIDADGNRLSRVFDKHCDALNWAKEIEVEAEQIRQGLRRKTDPSKTFNDLCDYWLEYRNSKKKNPKDDQSLIRVHLRPFFGGIRLTEITVKKVDELKASTERAHLSNGTWYNILKLLIAMLNQAVELKWLLERPNIRKPSVADVDFRFLSDKRMIRCLLETARDYGEHAYALYATAFYTGMREGELAGLHWGKVNLERRLITVCRSFSTTTKSHKIRRVPILDPLLGD